MRQDLEIPLCERARTHTCTYTRIHPSTSGSCFLHSSSSIFSRVHGRKRKSIGRGPGHEIFDAIGRGPACKNKAIWHVSGRRMKAMNSRLMACCRFQVHRLNGAVTAAQSVSLQAENKLIESVRHNQCHRHSHSHPCSCISFLRADS